MSPYLRGTCTKPDALQFHSCMTLDQKILKRSRGIGTFPGLRETLSEFSSEVVNLNDTYYKKDSSLACFAKNFDERVCLGHAGIFLLALIFIEQSKVDFIHFAKQC